MKTKCKKLLRALLCCMMLFGLLPTTAFAADDGLYDHTFNHIDVRIEGPTLTFSYEVYDGDNKIGTETKEVEAYVTGVNYVTIDGTTYNSGFSKDGDYEYRKIRGVSVRVTESSTAILNVDLIDKNGKEYNNISIQYDINGIRAAAENCNGYSNGRYDGLDFDVDKIDNGAIVFRSHGLSIPVQKYVQDTNGDATAFNGEEDAFTFELVETAPDQTTRSWTASTSTDGIANFVIGYLYSNITDMNSYAGKTYSYTLTEKAAEGYVAVTKPISFTVTFSKEANNSGGYDIKPIINGATTLPIGFVNKPDTPETVDVTVTKVWEDNNNQDGIRPNDVTVKLLADGKDTGKTLVLNSENNWTGSFTELDKYSKGKEIEYTVSEVTVEGYNTVISGTMTDGYTITNSHTPETTTVSGSKTWDDNNNQDGIRPESITIKLMNGNEVVETRTVTANDQWSWSFTDLAKYEAGELINYSLVEEATDEYSTTYDDYDITNIYTPKQTSVTVTKAWEDNNNQDGIRPNDVTVKLLADGKDTGKTLILNSENNWTGSFIELDKYSEGKEVEYTVSEVPVEGYNTIISGTMADGYTITNSHTPEIVPDNPDATQTGDTTDMGLWIVLLLAACFGIVGTAVYRKKKKAE